MKYLAGACRAADRNMDRAGHYYAAGYCYAAKCKGLVDRNKTNPIDAFASAAAADSAVSGRRK